MDRLTNEDQPMARKKVECEDKRLIPEQTKKSSGDYTEVKGCGILCT